MNKWLTLVFQILHTNFVCGEQDQAYVEGLVWDIVPRMIAGNEETIKIGNADIPVPPANVGELGYIY